jgi:hypothetical protein
LWKKLWRIKGMGKENDTKIKFHLGFSAITGKVYAGKMRRLKNGAMTTIGKRYDVTQDFYNALLQKFPVGHKTLIIVDENPKYRVTVEEISE